MEEVKIPITIEDGGFSSGMKRIIDRMETTKKEVDKTGMSMDYFAKHMQYVYRHFDKLTAAVHENTAAIGKDSRATKQLGQDFDETAGKGVAGFGRLEKAAIGFFTVQKAKEFVSTVYEVRSEIEKLETSLRTFVGNSAEANALIASIRKIPMPIKDLSVAAETMMGFGIAANEVSEDLEAIGNIARGDSQRFQSLSLAFSQTSSTGKLMGQDLLQMVNAGFNPLDQMAKTTGKDIATLKKEMSEGAISAEMVRQAFLDATGEGGKFYGMLEAQSKTMAGAYNELQRAIEDALNDIGHNSEGIMKGTLSVVSSLVESHEKVGKVIAGVVATYGTYRAALMTVTALQGLQTLGVGALTTAEAVHYGWLVLCEKAQKLLNTTMLSNPYVLAATAVAGLVAVLVTMKTEQERVNEAYDEYSQKKADIIRQEEEHKARIEDLARVASDESLSTETRRLALVELEQKYPAIFAKYDTEAEKLKHIRDLKAEIAALDGKGSITRASNELDRVEKRIKELEAIHTDYFINSAGGRTYTGRNRNDKEEAELMALQRRRGELTNQIKKDEANTYLTNLTGISNAELEKQIAERRNLIARMEVGGKKYGKVNKGGATGVYTKDELQGQLQILQSEQNRRKKVLEDSTKDFIAEANKAYKKEQAALRKLESLTDPKKRASSKQKIDGKKVSEMSGDEFLAAVEKQQKAVAEAKKKVDAYTVKGDAKDGADAASRRQKQFELEQKEAERQASQKRTLEEALEDAELAGVVNDAEREIKEREIQHKRKLQQIHDQADEWKKAAYKAAEERFNATNTDKSRTFADTKEGKAGWQEQSLSDEQKAIIEAREREENAIHARAIHEQYRTEAQAMRDFLKEYGDYEQKKLAITQEYEERIAEEQDPSKKAGLMMQYNRDLEALSAEQTRQQIDWDGIFSDLQGHTKDYLEGLRAQLQALISSGTLKLDEMEVAQGKIRDINALIAEQGGLFSFIGPLQIEYNRRLQEEADAKKLLEKAKAEQANQEAAVAMMRQTLSTFLTSNGKSINGEITADMANPFKEGTEEYKKFNDIIAKLLAGESKLAAAREKTANATQVAKNAEDKTTETGKQKWARIREDIENSKAYANVSSAPELLNSLGFGEASEKAQKGLDGMNDAIGAVTDFMSGNYIAALTKGISAVTNFGEALGLWSNSNRAEIEAANHKLETAMDVNTEAVNRLTKAMESASPVEAYKDYEMAKTAMESSEQAARQMMVNNTNLHDGGHSLWSDFLEVSGAQQVARQIFEYLGLKPSDGSYDIGTLVHDLTASQWDKLLKDRSDLMKALGEKIGEAEDEGNYNGILKDIIDFSNTYNQEAYDELKNKFQEVVTGVSFDGFKGKFKSALMDVRKDAQSLSDDFTEMLMQSVLDAQIEEEFGDKIKDLYDSWENALSDDNSLEGDIEELQRRQNELTQEMIQRRNYLAAQVGYTGSASSQQSATANSISNISYDQADSLVGITTSQTIAMEQGNATRDLILANLQTIQEIGSKDATVVELRNLIIDGNNTRETMLKAMKEHFINFTSQMNRIVTEIQNQ